MNMFSVGSTRSMEPLCCGAPKRNHDEKSSEHWKSYFGLCFSKAENGALDQWQLNLQTRGASFEIPLGRKLLHSNIVSIFVM